MPVNSDRRRLGLGLLDLEVENNEFLAERDMPTAPKFISSWHPKLSVEEPSPRSFILARTKFNAYNYSCTSFLDLVEGPDGIISASSHKQPTNFHEAPNDDDDTRYHQGVAINSSAFADRLVKFRTSRLPARSTGMVTLLLLHLLVLPVMANPDRTAIIPFVSSPTLQQPHLRQILPWTIGPLCGLLHASFAHLDGFLGEMLAISMGVSSVVWVMMRNSLEVQPKYSWT